MKYIIPLFIFQSFFVNVSTAQKKDWTGFGSGQIALRAGSWTMDEWGKFAVNINNHDTVFTTGLHGSPTPVAIVIQQMTKFIFWNFDASCSGNGKTKFTNDDSYFQPSFSNWDVRGRMVSASFTVAGGYLLKGRFGLYAGGRIGYDNVILKSTYIANNTDIMKQFGGQKAGLNVHLLFPFIGGMFRFSYFGDVTQNKDINLKAKTSETTFSWFIPFDKEKTAGATLSLDHLAYTTKDYLTSFKALNNSEAIHFKRTYFDIGFSFPVTSGKQ